MSKGVRRKGDRGGKGYERRENRKREGQKRDRHRDQKVKMEARLSVRKRQRYCSKVN